MEIRKQILSLRIRIGPFTFGKSGTRLSLWSRGSGFSIPIFSSKAQSFGKIKLGIFSFFFRSNAKKRRINKMEIDEKRPRNTRPSFKKNTHLQAYEPWTKEADEKLTLLFDQGKTIKELSKIFGRTEGAIRSRILH